MSRQEDSSTEAYKVAASSIEEDFGLYLAIYIEGYGDVDIHSTPMVNIIRREVKLNFGQGAKVIQVTDPETIQLLQQQMESEEVPKVDQETEVSELQE